MTTWRFYRYLPAENRWQLIGCQSGPEAYMFLAPPAEANIVTREDAFPQEFVQGYVIHATWKAP